MLAGLLRKNKHAARTLIALAVVFAVTACGGSGSPSQVTQPVTLNPALSISDAIVTEGDSATSTLQFTVQASVVAQAGAIIASASVDYSTTAGTATEGVDWNLVPRPATGNTAFLTGLISLISILNSSMFFNSAALVDNIDQ